ncbi:deaminase [Sulfobacillus harzensis]|uniref:Nucleoside deaminase n=1 Tax=Sulfobacillus harzensis TaxID=2729629 RepID=A0A7Y0L1H4_9FIRM|nr:nucleoside deaminase [Sulfobacillus harzensis]
MDISGHWQDCLELAWEAYRMGSVPVGAIFVDSNGSIRYRGRNRIFETSNTASGGIVGTRLAHAEINVLLQAPPEAYAEMAEGTLMTTLEPCPMCTGALVMSGIRRVMFGARDREAGSLGLLTQNAYMHRKGITVVGPEPVVQAISLTLMTAHILRVGGHRQENFLAAFSQDDRPAVRLGTQWFRNGTLDALARQSSSIDALLVAVATAHPNL